MRRLMLTIGLLAMGCGEGPTGSAAAPLWDGGRCDYPGAQLYELRFIPTDTDCGEVRTRVRRLDGPSDTGFCLSEPRGAEMCRIDLLEVCENLAGEGLVITGQVVYDRDEWRGVVDASFRDPEGAEVCAGRYTVRTRPVY